MPPVRKNVIYINDAHDDDDSSEEEQGRRIFVGNLPNSTTRDGIQKWLGEERTKNVVLIKLAREAKDRQTFKGYAFVTFKTTDQADEAVEKKDKTFWRQGDEKNDRARKINVKISPFFTKRGRCFWCGDKDHLSNHCTKNVSGYAGGVCYRCDQTGHLVKDCPKVALAKKNKEERDKAQEEHQRKWRAAKAEAGHATITDRKAKE